MTPNKEKVKTKIISLKKLSTLIQKYLFNYSCPSFSMYMPAKDGQKASNMLWRFIWIVWHFSGVKIQGQSLRIDEQYFTVIKFFWDLGF